MREDDLAAIQPEERDASEKQIAKAIKRELPGVDSSDDTGDLLPGLRRPTPKANRPPKFAK
jgi:hypothetical protein